MTTNQRTIEGSEEENRRDEFRQAFWEGDDQRLHDLLIEMGAVKHSALALSCLFQAWFEAFFDTRAYAIMGSEIIIPVIPPLPEDNFYHQSEVARDIQGLLAMLIVLLGYGYVMYSYPTQAFNFSPPSLQWQ